MHHAPLAFGKYYQLCCASFFLSAVSDDISLQTVPKELTQPERDDIVKYHKNLPLDEKKDSNHFNIDPPGKPTLFVKYGGDVLAEASTQSFFAPLAQPA